MAGNISASSVKANGEGTNYTSALIVLTSLFFMWGFITCLNDILITYLKGVFSLNYTQAMLVQFCFFGAYFIASVPAGRLDPIEVRPENGSGRPSFYFGAMRPDRFDSETGPLRRYFLQVV